VSERVNRRQPSISRKSVEKHAEVEGKEVRHLGELRTRPALVKAGLVSCGKTPAPEFRSEGDGSSTVEEVNRIANPPTPVRTNIATV
jgi:hypothetical protein